MKKTVLFYIAFFMVSATWGQGYLGVIIRDYNQNGMVGARIINILDSGAAKLAGLEENDIITAINNKSVGDRKELVTLLQNYNWGDEVKIDFIRSGVPEFLKLNLGYKKDTKTYQLHKQMIDNRQHWFFEDDHTVVVLDKEDKPISIAKKENGCMIDIWYVNETYKEAELPQCYLDLEDKLFSIKRIKQDQARRNVSIDYITYIRTTLEKDTAQQQQQKSEVDDNPSQPLYLETFSVIPNPSNGIFTIKIESANYTPFDIKIFDVTGRVIVHEYTGTLDGFYTKQFDFRTLARGTYLLQVLQSGHRAAKKIVFQ
jgi:membrane-associated protease RseP (regulator of RpoE activity)